MGPCVRRDDECAPPDRLTVLQKNPRQETARGSFGVQPSGDVRLLSREMLRSQSCRAILAEWATRNLPNQPDIGLENVRKALAPIALGLLLVTEDHRKAVFYFVPL